MESKRSHAGDRQSAVDSIYLEKDFLKYTFMTTQVFMTPASNHIKVEGLARPIGLLIRQQFYVSTSNVGLFLEGHI